MGHPLEENEREMKNKQVHIRNIVDGDVSIQRILCDTVTLTYTAATNIELRSSEEFKFTIPFIFLSLFNYRYRSVVKIIVYST